MSESQYEKVEKVISKLEEKNAKQILAELSEDWEEDATINPLVLMNRLENLSLISHKWARRVFDQNIRILDLLSYRETVFEKIKKIKQTSGDILDKERFGQIKNESKSWEYALRKEDPIIRMDRLIAEHKLLLEWLLETLNNSKWNLRVSCENIIKLRDLESRT